MPVMPRDSKIRGEYCEVGVVLASNLILEWWAWDGAYVSDNIHSRERLQKHERDTDGHPVPGALLEELEELDLLRHVRGRAVLDLLSDFSNFTMDIRSVGGQAAETDKNLLGAGEVVASGEPARRSANC